MKSEKVFKNTDDIIFADASYFEMFRYTIGYRVIQSGVLSDPKEVVLTEDQGGQILSFHEAPQQVIGNTIGL